MGPQHERDQDAFSVRTPDVGASPESREGSQLMDHQRGTASPTTATAAASGPVGLRPSSTAAAPMILMPHITFGGIHAATRGSREATSPAAAMEAKIMRHLEKGKSSTRDVVFAMFGLNATIRNDVTVIGALHALRVVNKVTRDEQAEGSEGVMWRML